MCRMAAYLGPPTPLSTLLFDAPHSLHEQAYRPREQTHGFVNVDGTGVAWWPSLERADPLCYVSERPPWADPNLSRLAPRLEGALQIATVRSATEGIPVGPGNVHPFVHGRLAFAHNGFLGGFRECTGRPLLERLPDSLWAEYAAVSDSLTLFLTLARHLEADPQSGLAAAAASAVAEATEVCAERDRPAVLNFAVADGERLVVTRAQIGTSPNSLYVCVDGPGVTVASEPLDESREWRPVPGQTLLQVTSAGIREQPLP